MPIATIEEWVRAADSSGKRGLHKVINHNMKTLACLYTDTPESLLDKLLADAHGWLSQAPGNVSAGARRHVSETKSTISLLDKEVAERYLNNFSIACSAISKQVYAARDGAAGYATAKTTKTDDPADDAESTADGIADARAELIADALALLRACEPMTSDSPLHDFFVCACERLEKRAQSLE